MLELTEILKIIYITKRKKYFNNSKKLTKSKIKLCIFYN